MPSKTKKQHNLMAAVAKNPAFAKKVGIKQSVGEDFLKARCKEILHEAEVDIWKPSYGNHLLEFLSMDTPKLSGVEETKEYLNLKNGFLNLSTFKLIPHTPDIFSFVQLPIQYHLEAQCPVFMDFIYDFPVVQGNNDPST